MNDTFAVRGGQRRRQVRGDFKRAFDRQRAFFQRRFQGPAGHEVHGQKHHVTVATEIVDAHYVGMADLPGQQDFIAKAFQRLGIRPFGGTHDLERDVDFQLPVEGAVDHPHAARARDFANVIPPGQARARGQHADTRRGDGVG